MRKLSVLILAIALLTMITGCTAATASIADTSYPAVVACNYIVYGISVETVSSDMLGNEIGQVIRNVSLMPQKDGDSNTVTVGSKLYSIKDTSMQDSIAVEIDGRYHKANKGWLLQ